MRAKLFKGQLLIALSFLIILSSSRMSLAQVQVQSANVVIDQNVVSVLKAISDASENFAAATKGQYPTSAFQLVATNPPFLPAQPCGQVFFNHSFLCTNSVGGYTYQAVPVVGGTTYTVTTGGVFSPVINQVDNNIAIGKNLIKHYAAASVLDYQISNSYPANLNVLVQGKYIKQNDCDQVINGFYVTCENSASSYKYAIKPYNPLLSGTQTHQITTGYVLVP